MFHLTSFGTAKRPVSTPTSKPLLFDSPRHCCRAASSLARIHWMFVIPAVVLLSMGMELINVGGLTQRGAFSLMKDEHQVHLTIRDHFFRSQSLASQISSASAGQAFTQRPHPMHSGVRTGPFSRMNRRTGIPMSQTFSHRPQSVHLCQSARSR